MFDFGRVYSQLKGILSAYQQEMVLVEDTANCYHLDTLYIMPNKKPMFFAAVKVNKSYVSFHLMAVYVFPELLNGISPQLKKHLGGKSCFNFKYLDESLLQELADLTSLAYKQYQCHGYLVSTT